MKKLRIAICLLYSICFVDQSLGGCNCNASSTQSNLPEQNGKTKIISNDSSQTDQSAKLSKKQLEELKEEELFKKELQELQEFLEQSKEENNGKIEDSK